MAKSYADIILMLRAGYSREEIDAFNDEDTAPAPQAAPSETREEPAEATNAQPVPETSPAPQPVPEPSPAPQAADAGNNELLAAIKALTAAVQTGNRAAAEMGANIIDPQTAGVNALAGMSNINFDKGGTN